MTKIDNIALWRISVYEQYDYGQYWFTDKSKTFSRGAPARTQYLPRPIPFFFSFVIFIFLQAASENIRWFLLFYRQSQLILSSYFMCPQERLARVPDVNLFLIINPKIGFAVSLSCIPFNISILHLAYLLKFL